MALAIDGSTPAKVTGTSAAITTGAFSPPANSLLVAFTARNGPAGNNDDGTVSSTGGLSWNLAGRKSTNAGSTDGAGTEACAEIWWAFASSAPGSITVTDTRADAATGIDRQHILQVEVITGSETTWGGAIHGTSSASGLPSTSVTTTNGNSWVFAVASDWAAAGLGTVGTGQTMIAEDNVVGQYSAHIWRQTSTTASSGTAVTMNLTAPSGEQYNELAVEIREPASLDAGGHIQSGFHPGRGPTRARFYQSPKSSDVLTVGQTFTQDLAGTVTPSGALTNLTAKPLAGAVTPAGALAKQAAKPLAGTVTPSGSLAKQANKALAGAVTPTGALITVKVVLRSFAGTSTPSGALAKLVAKPLAGTSTPSGALAKQVAKALAGSVTGVGTLTKRVAKALAGTITPSGALSLTRVVLRSFAGAITPAGALTRQANKALSGTVIPAGSLAKRVARALAGLLTPAGSLAKRITRPFTGQVTPSGTVTAIIPQATVAGTMTASTIAGKTSPATAAAHLTDTTAGPKHNPSSTSGRIRSTTTGGQA